MRKFTSGDVLKIAPLPDPASFMSNPDLKLYATDVTLDGGQMLRPGMSAKVEIVIAQLKNVLTVPIQCVSNRAGKKICYVHTSSKSEEREIKVGLYNDKFVQILEGLKEGEKVLLSPPRIYDQPQQAADSSAKPADDNQAENGPPPKEQPGQGLRPGGQDSTNRPPSDGQVRSRRPRPGSNAGPDSSAAPFPNRRPDSNADSGSGRPPGEPQQ